jgi:SAM-dependent methyltransferase
MEQQQHASARQWDWIGLHQWYQRPLGKLLSRTESTYLAGILPLLFGYHIIALGVPSGCDILATSTIAQRYYLDITQPSAGLKIDLLAEPCQLPIASDCIDVAVLPHTLEFVEAPQAVLQEVDRVLIPEGYVIILGFNPISLWGLWRLLHSRKHGAPWNARFFSVTQLHAWLTPLGFELISTQYYFYRPPSWQSSLLNRLTFLESVGSRWWFLCGGGYALLAKKRVSTLIPIKPRWRSHRHRLTADAINRT